MVVVHFGENVPPPNRFPSSFVLDRVLPESGNRGEAGDLS